jgi:hypothetical protein
MTHFTDKELIQRLFIKFRGRYGHLWTSRLTSDEEWADCAQDWHQELSQFDIEVARAAINQSLSQFKDFPPTLGQIIDLCNKHEGIPSADDVIKSMERREFNHPIVKMIYDKVGSWALKNGSAHEVKSKTQAAYNDCLCEFRSNPEECWSQLTLSNEQLKLEAPEAPKTSPKGERIMFADRLRQYQQHAAEEMLKLKDQKHPEFPENKLKRNGRDFDHQIFAEYKKYLMSVPERLVLSLPKTYTYDRMRFLTQSEVPALLREKGYSPTPQGNENNGSTRPTGPTVFYKNWMAG